MGSIKFIRGEQTSRWIGRYIGGYLHLNQYGRGLASVRLIGDVKVAIVEGDLLKLVVAGLASPVEGFKRAQPLDPREIELVLDLREVHGDFEMSPDGTTGFLYFDAQPPLQLGWVQVTFFPN